MTALDNSTIRGASVADAETRARLAGRDSTRLPSDDFLIAEVAGETVAAVGIRTGAIAADPFHPTAEAVELLRLRAERVRRADRSGFGPGLFRRLRATA